MSKHAEFHSDQSPISIPSLLASQPPSTTSTVNTTSSTGISADASYQHAPKHHPNRHLPPTRGKNSVWISAFSANSADQENR
jgi:hypothetical protein